MGLDIETRSRVEHLPEAEMHKFKSINPLQDFLGAAQDHTPSASIPAIQDPAQSTESQVMSKKAVPLLSMEEYFTPPEDKDEYDGKRTWFV